MSKRITVDSELLLYSLKYAIANDDVDSDKVIKNIANNMDDLDNDELVVFIQAIDSSETVEAKNSEYTWLDLKEVIEKEIFVRNSVNCVMDVFKKRVLK